MTAPFPLYYESVLNIHQETNIICNRVLCFIMLGVLYG